MKMREKLLTEIQQLETEIIEVSRFIHANPELGYEENKCSEFLSNRLKEHGFKVERNVASLPTAIRASFTSNKPGPAVGFIAEYDALPDIGHGCGHNLIAASAFGAAVALSKVIQEVGGSVWFFGTPAEETDGGKVPMIAHGVFKQVDAVMMMHPEGFYLVNTVALALDALEFQYEGKATHAAATPHEGVNALDAILLLFNGVNALRQQVKPDVRIHGIITKGGVAPNIIPDLTEAKFYVRANDRAYLNIVTEKVKNVAQGAAIATGCKLSIKNYERSMDNQINNPVLSQLIDKNLRDLGITEIALHDDVPGSTDFGNLSHEVPAAGFYCATAPKGSDLHTGEFAALSVTQHAHEHTVIAVKTMALSGLELLEHPQLVEEVKNEHR